MITHDQSRFAVAASLLCCALLGSCFAANFASADGPSDNNSATVRRIPKLGIIIPPQREAALRDKLSTLQQQLAELSTESSEVTRWLPDVMIFERAVRSALDYQEFFAEEELERADRLLDEGLARAAQLHAGKGASWLTTQRLTVSGYISRIDGSVQPYGLVVPGELRARCSDADTQVGARCDIWFHGRGETLSELNFLWDRLHNAGQYTPKNTLVLHPYGRYSNAFKFAGEVDVLEAIEDTTRHFQIDPERTCVRGFSMGGAACWQFATHYSDRWFAANPGAGFSETPRFLQSFQQETLTPTAWQRKLWNLYDCDQYALNLFHCPTIAYSGELDRQKQAADVMAEAMARHHVRLRHVIGADMGHKIDDASKQTIEAAMHSLAKRGRETLPNKIHFQTYTLKYNRMHWLTIDSLGEHWVPARVDATLAIDTLIPSVAIDLQTENVTGVSLDFPAGTFNLTINAQTVTVRSGGQSMQFPGPLSDGSWKVQLAHRTDGSWEEAAVDDSLRKRHHLQGPIDDALMDSFVFVRPTGTATSALVGHWCDSELERAIEHWRRHFRGDARVVDDTDVTAELAGSANLVLWGDPSSNRVLAKIAGDLPIIWSADTIQVGKLSYPAGHHALIMVYPNPLNPNRYVVLNSSFTFRDYAYLNNARQVPMLPDWAVIDLNTPAGNVDPGKVVAADFFDESWRLK